MSRNTRVLPSAVSIVFANRPEERRLAAAAVERIRQAVRELGYVPTSPRAGCAETSSVVRRTSG